MSSNLKSLKRIGAAVYRRVPSKTRGSIEQILAPLSFRFFTRGKNFYCELPLSIKRPVSIVIPSYNDLFLLKPLIASIEQTCTAFEYEIIISDDYCQESNTAKLKELETAQIKVVTTNTRTGFAGAVNRGMQNAKWDVVLLNSDMIALPHWLNNLQHAAYEIDPKIGLVSPHLLYPTGRIQYGGTFHLRVNAPQWFSHLDQGRVANFKAANTQKYIKGISGAAVYIKREVINAIGMLDDKYWLGFEDVDYAFTARKAGFRCFLESRAKLVHLESATRGKVQGPKEYASMRRFWAKWKPQNSKNKILNLYLLLDHNSPEILHQFATNLKSSLESSGLATVKVQKLNLINGRDENIISSLKDFEKVVISLDRSSLTTNWLTTEQTGKSWVYFPDFKMSGFDINNPKHVSQLQPEFGYLPSSHEQAQRYKELIPWHISIPVAPAMKVSARVELEGESISILLIDATNEQSEYFKVLASEYGVSIKDVSSSTLFSEPSHSLASITVAFTHFQSSVIPMKLMANGTCLVSQASEYTKFEVLDGFNAFTFKHGDVNRALEQTKQLLECREYLDSVQNNAKRTVTKIQNNIGIKIIEILNSENTEVLPL